MKRREFITLLGGAAAGWPLSAYAQQGERVRRIGMLLGVAEGDPQARDGLAGFRKSLAELGWIEGRNVRIDIRWAEADKGRMASLAAELVGLQPDVIVSQTTPVVAALQQQTKSIPIVFVIVSDPVGSGFVASLPRPGGNITGFINIEASLGGKWIEMLKEISPGVKRAALLFNPDTATYSSYYRAPFEAAARSNGIEPISAHARSSDDIQTIFTGLGDKRDSALAVMPDAFTATRRNLDVIIAQAAEHRVPTIYPYRYMVTGGGLISYGIDTPDLYRRAPAYVDRILKGANPADLPVQLPTKFETAINLKTARILGIEIPATLLGRADEVIE